MNTNLPGWLIEDQPGSYSAHDLREPRLSHGLTVMTTDDDGAVRVEPIRHSTRHNVDDIPKLGALAMLGVVALLVAALALGLLTGVTF